MQFSDISSPAFYENPYPVYERLRAAGKLVPIAPRLWVTGNHDICEAILRDRRMGRAYMAGVRARYGEEQATAPVFTVFERMMLLMNPPDHTRLRALLMKAFNASQSDAFFALARKTADDLIDGFIAKGAADIMRDYAVPLPLKIICQLLDVPFDGHVSLGDVVNDLAQVLELAPMHPEQIAAAGRAAATLQDYFRPILRDRRRRPGGDLISLLSTVAEGEDSLTEDEVLANIVLLFMAGHETTSNMIGNALVCLHREPAQLAKVLGDPALLPNAITECMRFDGSVQLGGRSVLEPVEIAGQELLPGEMVFLFLGAANRDPQAFDHADALKVDRDFKHARPLSFGGGIHHCLGSRLAMIELEIGLGTLFKRIPGMRLPGLDDLRWHQRNTLRGVQGLRAEW